MASSIWRVAAVLAMLSGAAVAQFDLCFPDTAVSNEPANRFNFTGVDRFGMDLMRELERGSTGAPDSNLLFSPYSIWSALSLALMGAQGNSRDQLEQALGLPNTKIGAYRTKYALDFVLNALGSGADGRPEIRRSDRAYFDRSINLRPCVTDVIRDLQVMNFSSDPVGSADTINRHVSSVTGGQINDLLDSNSLVNAFFVLVNAIYFKGEWKYKFNTKDTTKQVFYQATGEQAANVDMMKVQAPLRVVKSPALGATILEMPYLKSNMSMLILLPDAENPDVEGVLNALSPWTLSQALLASKPLNVRAFIPKFDIKTELQDQLIQALGRVGVTDIFDRTRSDFSDFSNDGLLYIDSAVHQAKVTVDEQGTVASGATAFIGTRSGPASNPVQFVANRPFVFLLYEKRVKVSLFAGVVRNPTK